MKTKSIFLIILSLLFFSCSSDDDVMSVVSIQQYNKVYMHYPQSFTSQNPRLVNLSYFGGKVVKRSFGVSILPPDVGEVYENVIYELNKIAFSAELDFQDYIMAPNHRTYHLDDLGRISKKIFFDESLNVFNNDTLNFEYNQNGLLYKIEKNQNSYNRSESFYYFNTSRNLDSIVTNKYYLDYATSSYEYNGKTVEIFNGYDASPNPLKHLGIFDELFYRSLSTNNYSEYKLYEYDHLGVLSVENIRDWSFVYDPNGEIRFDLF